MDKNLKKLYESDPEYWQHSKLGVAYTNLRVYGIANDVDYQPTVTNLLWKWVVKRFESILEKMTRPSILIY